jgi:CRISPR-associated exonuclease Cas4
MDSGKGGEFAVWELVTFIYCPREFYLYRKLGFTPPPLKKMEFSKIQHEKEEKRIERRKNIYGVPAGEVVEILHDIAVEDLDLGLYGKVDTVLRLRSGELLPVEVKYSNLKYLPRAWRKQMIAYATLLERKLNRKVSKGIFYILPRKEALWVRVESEEKLQLKKDVERMRKIVNSDSIPPVSDTNRCKYCEMIKYCRRV